MLIDPRDNLNNMLSKYITKDDVTLLKHQLATSSKINI